MFILCAKKNMDLIMYDRCFEDLNLRYQDTY